MRLKFEKNKVHCRISQIEAVELVKTGMLSEKVCIPSDHTFTYQVKLSELNQNIVSYIDSTLAFEITEETIVSLATNPTKDGITFLQDKAAYVFEVDIRKERRKKIRKI